MTQVHPETMNLTPTHVSEVPATDVPAHLARMDAIAATDGDSDVGGFISEVGRIFAVRDGAQILVTLDPIDLSYETFEPYGMYVSGWAPRKSEARAFIGTDDNATRQDLARLFIAQTVDLNPGVVRLFAGWRHRYVITIAEEVGMKECKTFRTKPGGNLDWEHTYNASTTVGLFSTWASELAMEFGGYDHVNRQDTDGENSDVIRAFIMREAADAALTQARFDLNAAMVMHTMKAKNPAGPPVTPVAQLARSLHTDRPNLTRHAKIKPDSALADMFGRTGLDAAEAMLRGEEIEEVGRGQYQPKAKRTSLKAATKRAPTKRR